MTSDSAGRPVLARAQTGIAHPASLPPTGSLPETRQVTATAAASGRTEPDGHGGESGKPAGGGGDEVTPACRTGVAAGGTAPRPAVEPAGPGPLLRVVRRPELAFAVVGAVNTLMGMGLTVAWLALLDDAAPPSAGVAAAYGTGIGIAFFLHRHLVFRVRGRVFRDFAGFAAVNCGGLLANALLLELAVTVLGFPRAPAAVVIMGAVAVGSYFGHRYVSFRRPVV